MILKTTKGVVRQSPEKAAFVCIYADGKEITTKLVSNRVSVIDKFLIAADTEAEVIAEKARLGVTATSVGG